MKTDEKIKAQRWWNSLCQHKKRDIEMKEYGEPYEFEPSELGEMDIINLFNKYYYETI